MYPPITFQRLKFAIREVPAFVGHSFDDLDKPIVDQIIQIITKLGVQCESGRRAEALSVSEKVRERISAAEIFVGIFTRRDEIRNGQYSTSPWVIEEKAAAIAANKPLLLFVENGVHEFGGLQGDYEYIPFDRNDLAPALIRAVDYILSITSVPLHVRMEGPNKLTLTIGQDKPKAEQLEDLKNFVRANPTNSAARLALAEMMSGCSDPMGAQSEFSILLAENPNNQDLRHRYAHFLERRGDLAAAIGEYQKALDLSPSNYKNNRCLGRCLYKHAKSLPHDVVRKSTLNKAKRLIERAFAIGGESCRVEIDGDLFVINEELSAFDTLSS